MRPSVSRTAAPSGASVRARAERASVTSFASSAFSSSMCRGLRPSCPLRFRRRDRCGRSGSRADHHGADAHPAPRVLAALGVQPQPGDLCLGARQRNPTQPLCEQSDDGLHVVVGEVDAEQIAEVVHAQPGRHPDGAVGEMFDRRRARRCRTRR